MTSHDRRLRILYLMPGDWDWAKQRPHYLAEELALHHDVDVVYPIVRNRRALAGNPRPKRLTFHRYMHLPFRFRMPFIYALDRGFVQLQMRLILRSVHPDIAWLGFPELVQYLPPGFSAPLIYDCMDDALSVPELRRQSRRLAAAERSLVEKAVVVVVSSNDLLRKLQERYGIGAKTVLIRNAYGGSVMSRSGQAGRHQEDGVIRLGYVGISSKVDKGLVSAVLRALPGAVLHAIGPGAYVFDQDVVGRVVVHGPVSHDQLADMVGPLDVLIAPMKMGELTRSSDPVKLYDYVNFDKPIVCVRYPEVEWLSPFVDFYSTAEEFVETVRRMARDGFQPKYTEDQRLQFLADNSWAQRAKTVEGVLRGLKVPTEPSRGNHG
jgi:teichuronic acid biosynthesis glycosyltransferase TuaH